MTSEPESAPGRRGYVAALGLMAVGGVLLLVGFGLTWAHAEVALVAGASTATTSVDLTGRDLLPLAAASGWIALAGLAGIIATRSWGRVTVAAVVLTASLAGLVSTVAFVVAPAGFVDAAAPGSAAFTGGLGWGWLVALAGGLTSCLAAGATVIRGRQWPTLGSRYQRTPSARSAWDLQDMGQDPSDDLVE